VELGKEEFVVEASQGTHFFHNLISANVCYLALQDSSELDFLDWDEIKSWDIVEKGEFFVQRRSPTNLEFLVDSSSNKAVLRKMKK